MKTYKLIIPIITVVLFLQISVFAQYAPRQDAVWARTVPAGTITMDGVLDEEAWSLADSMEVVYGQDGPLPTSGYRAEFQEDAVTDPTHAVVKFLVTSDNQLWLGFVIPDSSIGGTQDWARWDGILMNIKDKLDPDELSTIPKPVECFYTWWISGFPFASSPIVGGFPVFRGNDLVGNNSDTTRTEDQIAIWDARTVVYGTSNDAERDEKWVVEMRLDLAAMGYDVTQTDGDLIALNFSIWDSDYLFEGDPLKISTTRTHLQNPWSTNGNNALSIYAKPDVDLTAELPVIEPDVIIPNGADFADPVIDGLPDDDVWTGAYTFDLGWDIENLRQNYPGLGKFMSGHYQAEIGGNPRPAVLDPSLSTIKMFFKDNYLYFLADVNDGRVEGSEVYDEIDGVRLTVAHRNDFNDDHFMNFKQLRVNFNGTGVPTAYEYLTTLIDSGKAEFAVSLKGSTTVNNKSDIDKGYYIEMKIDLTGLGYPADLGDKLLFGGVMLADGDSFDDPLSDYGTRSYWFREHDGGPVTAWCVLDTNTRVVGVEEESAVVVPSSIQLYGNYPNPFNPSTTIKFAIPEKGDVNVLIYNAVGEQIRSINLLNRVAGNNEYTFNAENISSGVYFYKVALMNPTSGSNYISKTGKMILLK